MTWYAHHVFAAPAAIPMLSSAFPDHVFHVRDLDTHRRTEREVHVMTITSEASAPECRDVSVGPRLPEGGLVVVRELFEPDTHAEEWFGAEDGVSWRDVGAIDPAVLAPTEVDAQPAPPLPLLGFLRSVSRATASVVSLCCIGTWGGATEYANAWVFDDAWNDDRVYVHTGDGVRAWSSRRAARAIIDGDVLTLALTTTACSCETASSSSTHATSRGTSTASLARGTPGRNPEALSCKRWTRQVVPAPVAVARSLRT